MNKDHPLTNFHRWIENRRWFREDDVPISLAIVGAGPQLCSRIGDAVAGHLSAADPAAPGGWLFFGRDLVRRATTRSGLARLAETFPQIATRYYRPCSERRCEFLGDVARIGGAVFSLPEAHRSLREHPNLFVAGFSSDQRTSDDHADLAVDLTRLGESTCVRVIADSAIEWAQSGSAHNSSKSITWRSLHSP